MTPIEEQNKQRVLEVFEQWKAHPGTVLMVRALEELKKRHVANGVKRVTDSEVPDAEFRRIMSNIQTLEVNLLIMGNFDVFWKTIEDNKQ